MTAIVFELGGFQITNGAYLNQSALPNFNSTAGPNLAGVKHQNYTAPADKKTISANVGDIVTLYIQGINAAVPPQFQGIAGHGFTFSPSIQATSGGFPGTIPLGGWYSVTFAVTQTGTYVYFCTIPCSNGHGQMMGDMVVTCG